MLNAIGNNFITTGRKARYEGLNFKYRNLLTEILTGRNQPKRFFTN
jgi:hypothetical protein